MHFVGLDANFNKVSRIMNFKENLFAKIDVKQHQNEMCSTLVKKIIYFIFYQILIFYVHEVKT